MLEDMESDMGLVHHMLKKNGIQFDIKRVDTGQEFSDAILNYCPDVILSDHSLPQFSSAEALEIYKESQLNVPFILVTGSVSEEFAVTCLKQGADDYILKSNLLRLPRAIETALLHREQTKKQRQSDEERRQQYDALIKLNQELDNFVYSLSHNIRAPLTSVMGLLNLVQHEDNKRDGFFSAYFDMMKGSIRKLDDTIKEIMKYSRNARSEIKTEEIDVQAIVKQSLEKLKYLAGFDRVEQTLRVRQEHPFYSDPYRLEMILSNLFDNAIKYVDETKEKCTLDIEIVVQGNLALITVADNGIGIEADQLPRIFDMFYRATVVTEGGGLGLYIVREAVNRLGGQVTIDSQFGVGTVCNITLPAMH